ncbi:MAG: GH25 family lysozyme [Polyangiales bacterium]
MRARSLRVRVGSVALIASACAASACSAGAPPTSVESIDSVEQRVSVCAAGPMVLGVDVSVYQGDVNWSSVKSNGIDFAIARISDGSYLDTKFGANWPGMKAAGLVRGSYQFFEPGEDPTMQANIVINAVGKLGDGDLPVVADMEVTGSQSAATIVANLKTWSDAVTIGTGKAPFIYTGKYFWQDNVGDSTAFSSVPLWVAAYNGLATCVDIPDKGWSNWKMWQYTDAASVSGISGGVDGDRFNGTLADLQAFAGGSTAAGPTYGASYVSQSWPLATTSMAMTAGQKVAATLALKNSGTADWDSHTKIGTTQARDRSSAFVSSDWLAPNRLAAVSGTVKPGDSYTFKWTFQAPSTPGTYKEFFGVVQDGVAWFSDPGELGPPDNDMEAWIVVSAAKWAAEVVGMSFTKDAVTVAPGASVDGWIELKNVGTETWKAGVTKLAPTPRDVASPYAASSWLSPTRVSAPAADVAAGASFKFPVTITAPAGSTSGVQTFGVVEEGVAWFSDGAAGGGGPADDAIALQVNVSGSTATTDGGSADVGGVSPGGDAGVSSDAALPHGDGGVVGSGLASASGSCSMSTRSPARESGFAALMIAALAITSRRRPR